MTVHRFLLFFGTGCSINFPNIKKIWEIRTHKNQRVSKNDGTNACREAFSSVWNCLQDHLSSHSVTFGKQCVLKGRKRLQYITYSTESLHKIHPPWLLPWHSYIPFYREVVATECINTSFLLQNVKSNLSIVQSQKIQNAHCRPRFVPYFGMVGVCVIYKCIYYHITRCGILRKCTSTSTKYAYPYTTLAYM